MLDKADEIYQEEIRRQKEDNKIGSYYGFNKQKVVDVMNEHLKGKTLIEQVWSKDREVYSYREIYVRGFTKASNVLYTYKYKGKDMKANESFRVLKNRCYYSVEQMKAKKVEDVRNSITHAEKRIKDFNGVIQESRKKLHYGIKVEEHPDYGKRVATTKGS